MIHRKENNTEKGNVPNILKPGTFNLLEPYEPVQACNGIALPLPLP
jgi:hypothetical protein